MTSPRASMGMGMGTGMGVADWCARRVIDKIVVVSPHLDDGAFSAHTVLAQTQGPRKLLATVFSDAPIGGQTRWARLTGFATTQDEFIARRLEDETAARFMGVQCLHLNEHTGSWSAEAAERVVARLIDALNCPPASALCLLPAGAGGQLSKIAHWLRRTRRAPLGAMPHSEHVAVRDLLLQPLRDRGTHIGFYAELPYVWADRIDDLQARLRQRTGLPLTAIEVPPDLGAKHAAASAYRSQLAHILGVKPSYQRRVLSHREVFFMPA